MSVGAARLSRMEDPARWEEPELDDFLAEQLAAGRVALVLGAGASFGFGLPGWRELTLAAARVRGCDMGAGKTDGAMAEDVWRACRRDELLFANTIREALYAGGPIEFHSLISNELMRALGAMSMASSRGHVSQVVSFNFDDLLERYLDYYGFATESISTEPSWQSKADVTVFHMHGLLPSDISKPVTRIVFTQLQFDEMVVDAKNAWRRRVIQILCSHTCLFVGLSGNDFNLRTMLMEVKPIHASRLYRHANWGVRFSKADDPLREMWSERGVCQVTVSDFAEIPPILLGICQKATKLWRER